MGNEPSKEKHNSKKKTKDGKSIEVMQPMNGNSYVPGPYNPAETDANQNAQFNQMQPPAIRQDKRVVSNQEIQIAISQGVYLSISCAVRNGRLWIQVQVKRLSMINNALKIWYRAAMFERLGLIR